MAGERIRLEVQEREQRGTSESRRLRRAGMIPGVLYGNGKKPHPICVAERELRRVLTGGHGLHAILDVVLAGQKTTHSSVLKDYQVDPIRGKIEHFDLQEVRLDQAIQSSVTIELVGESVGAKAGGVLSQVAREIRVEALPLEVPERLELDVSRMEIGDSLRLSDLATREGVTYLDDPETVLATVTVPTKVEEPEPEEVEGEEGEEVEGEVAEGEEAPEGTGEEPAESEAEAAGESGSDEG
jgi:large subunit ribosomal protein L25